jgi:alanyl-tRNA synthetase
MQAKALWHEATLVGPVRVVRAHLPDSTSEDLKHLAKRLAAEPRTVALLAAGQSATGGGTFTFACSDNIDAHMGHLVRRACAAIGGRGGGQPQFAQGGSPEADHVRGALETAFEELVDALQG